MFTKAHKIAIFDASGFSRETADVALIDQIEELVFIDLVTTCNTYYGFPLLSRSSTICTSVK